MSGDKKMYERFLKEVSDKSRVEASAKQKAGKGPTGAKELYTQAAAGKKDRKSVLKQSFLEVKLKQEEQKRAQNEKKLERIYEDLMRKTENEELRKALEQECRNFSRRMAAMDEEVERKVVEINQSDQQHKMLTEAFNDSASKLLEFQEDKINWLIHEYNSNLQEILDKANDELDANTVKHRNKMDQLTDQMFALDSTFNDEEKELEEQRKDLQKFMELRGIRETQNLRIATESLLEEYWRQYEDLLYNFNKNTSKLKTKVAKRLRVDAANAQTYSDQQSRMERLQRSLKSVKSKVRGMHRETANTLNAISREQKILFDHYMKLRKVLQENEKVRNMQLVKLCTDSEGALRNLRECLELAERIVKLAHMCRCLESESEKVTPFMKEEHINPAEAKVLHEKMWKNFKHPLNKDVYIYSRVGKLEQRMSKAILDDATIRAELHQYDKSVDWLKKQLKLYLEDISVTTQFDEWDKCNKLLTVKPLEDNTHAAASSHHFFDPYWGSFEAPFNPAHFERGESSSSRENSSTDVHNKLTTVDSASH